MKAEKNVASLRSMLKDLEMDHESTYDEKWDTVSRSVVTDAFELAEALRIIIEPTKASKFQ